MEVPLTVSESCDGYIPKTLDSVIHSIEDHVGTPTRNQLISGLFYVLMQESGYILMHPSEFDETTPNSSKDFDGNERRTMTFNLSRLLSQASLVTPLLESPDGPYKLPLQLVGVQDYRFKLLIAPSSDDLMVVNLLVRKEDIEDCFSIAIRVSTFVPNPKSESVAGKFADLRTLSIIFKDNIAHKGRSAVLNAEGVVNNSLVGLMDEIKHKIIKKLPVNDLLNLSATCQCMLTLKQDKSTWRTLLWRDFHHKVPEDTEQPVDSLIETYQRLRVEKRSFKKWMEDTDGSVLEDNFSLDFDSEFPRVEHDSSYEFHPYFIIDIHNEVHTRNSLVESSFETTALPEYRSHTRIPKHWQATHENKTNE